VRFQVLTAASVEMTAFWDIARVISLKQMLEAVCTSETSVYFNKTTLGYIPQGCHLQNYEENILGQEKIYKMETGKTQSEEIHVCVYCVPDIIGEIKSRRV
jgi:hypothetical protein